jgi:hypothetical protein
MSARPPCPQATGRTPAPWRGWVLARATAPVALPDGPQGARNRPGAGHHLAAVDAARTDPAGPPLGDRDRTADPPVRLARQRRLPLGPRPGRGRPADGRLRGHIDECRLVSILALLDPAPTEAGWRARGRRACPPPCLPPCPPVCAPVYLPVVGHPAVRQPIPAPAAAEPHICAVCDDNDCFRPAESEQDWLGCRNVPISYLYKKCSDPTMDCEYKTPPLPGAPGAAPGVLVGPGGFRTTPLGQPWFRMYCDPIWHVWRPPLNRWEWCHSYCLPCSHLWKYCGPPRDGGHGGPVPVPK